VALPRTDNNWELIYCRWNIYIDEHNEHVIFIRFDSGDSGIGSNFGQIPSVAIVCNFLDRSIDEGDLQDIGDTGRRKNGLRVVAGYT
jgi:hypothetical protein